MRPHNDGFTAPRVRPLTADLGNVNPASVPVEQILKPKPNPQVELKKLPVLMNTIHQRLRVNAMSCCGLLELSGISMFAEPKEAVIGTFTYATVGKSGVVLFTQARINAQPMLPTYGDRLKDYILQEKLGTVAVMPEFVNRNTQRIITVFHWNIDEFAAKAWFYKNAPDLIPFFNGDRPEDFKYPTAVFHHPQAWTYEAYRKFPVYRYGDIIE